MNQNHFRLRRFYIPAFLSSRQDCRCQWHLVSGLNMLALVRRILLYLNLGLLSKFSEALNVFSPMFVPNSLTRMILCVLELQLPHHNYWQAYTALYCPDSTTATLSLSHSLVVFPLSIVSRVLWAATTTRIPPPPTTPVGLHGPSANQNTTGQYCLVTRRVPDEPVQENFEKWK